jgi:hypothetical protein
MVSGFDSLSFEFFSVLLRPDKIITAFFGLLIWILIFGLIFSVVFKKYSFLGYPISTWPGWGFLAATVMGLLMLIEVLIGYQPFSNGIALAIAMVILLLLYGFVVFLKRLFNK